MIQIEVFQLNGCLYACVCVCVFSVCLFHVRTHVCIACLKDQAPSAAIACQDLSPKHEGEEISDKERREEASNVGVWS